MENLWKNKSFCSLFFYAFFVQIVQSFVREGNIVPVMIWSGESSLNLVNPLHRTTKLEFQQLLDKKYSKVHLPIIVLVISDNFCIEDIKQYQESLQQLNNSSSLNYLSLVEDPVSVLKNLSYYNVTMEENIESFMNQIDQFNEGQLVTLKLNDFNVVFELYNLIQESSSNLVIVLTGKYCKYLSSERTKRALNSIQDLSPFIISNKNILFYADKNPSIKFNQDDYIDLDSLSYSNMQINDKHYNLTMRFDGIKNTTQISLKAQFDIINGDFRFSGFEFTPNENLGSTVFLKSRNDIVFPFNFSYHCSKKNLFIYKNKNTEIVVKLSNLQIQMDTEKFNIVHDCVGFMSIPIWTGIFVTAILAIIMIWGLTMIIDIRTMDRFDDPKSKTITICAQD